MNFSASFSEWRTSTQGGIGDPVSTFDWTAVRRATSASQPTLTQKCWTTPSKRQLWLTGQFRHLSLDEDMPNKRNSVELSLDLLEDQMECLVCLDPIFSPPVYQCCNGHLVCFHCKMRLEHAEHGQSTLNGPAPKCPTCTEPVTSRNRIVENLIINLKKECCYEGFGCKTRLLLSELEAHERECDFRHIACPISKVDRNCTHKYRPVDMAEHLTRKHSDLVLMLAGERVIWKLQRLEDYVRRPTESFCLQEACKRFFLVQIKTDERHNFHFSVSLVGKLSEAATYFYSIEFLAGNAHFLYRDEVQPLDHGLDILIPLGKSVEVTPGFLRKFIDQKCRLPFAVTIRASANPLGGIDEEQPDHPPLVKVVSNVDMPYEAKFEIEEEHPAEESQAEEEEERVIPAATEEFLTEEEEAAEEHDDDENPEILDEIFDNLPPVDDDTIGLSNQVVVTTSESACLGRRGSLLLDLPTQRLTASRRVSSD